MGTRQLQVIRGSCHHDCPDTCVWEVGVDEGRAVTLRGAPDHPTTRGALCPKVNRFLDRVYHRDRLRTPLRRTGAKGAAEFTPISWDEALGEIASRMQTLRDAGRTESILQYSFAGTQGVIQSGVVADVFFDRLGASDIRRHLCGATSSQGAADVLGQPFGIDPLELEHARTIVLWGTNTLITNRHLWPTIEAAGRAGALVIAIDPIRTTTAAKADVHLAPRPGTDVALILGVVHVLERDGLLDREWLHERTTGWQDLLASAGDMSPQTASGHTGIPPEQIEWLAHRMATAGPTAVRTLIGAEHRRSGREIMRAIAMLPAALGAMRQRGGGLARSTQVYFDTALQLPQRTVRRRFNMARLGALLTQAASEEAIALLVVHNCNPAATVPDQNRIIAGLEREDLFTVVLEQFMTDTARYADIVLPVTTQLEHHDVGLAWGHLFLSLNRAAIAPVGQALANSEIFRRLASLLGLDDDPWLRDDDEALIRRVLDSGHPWLDGVVEAGLFERGWARLNVDATPQPERYRLGALQFDPPDAGRSEEVRARFPLMLQTCKEHVRFLNSHYAGFATHLPQHGELRVSLHPKDAAARGIESGMTVDVSNERGVITAVAHVAELTQQGLVSMPFGWWNRATPQGRGVNALTNPEVPDDDQGSAAFHDTWVEVLPSAPNVQ